MKRAIKTKMFEWLMRLNHIISNTQLKLAKSIAKDMGVI